MRYINLRFTYFAYLLTDWQYQYNIQFSVPKKLLMLCKNTRHAACTSAYLDCYFPGGGVGNVPWIRYAAGVKLWWSEHVEVDWYGQLQRRLGHGSYSGSAGDVGYRTVTVPHEVQQFYSSKWVFRRHLELSTMTTPLIPCNQNSFRQR